MDDQDADSMTVVTIVGAIGVVFDIVLISFLVYRLCNRQNYLFNKQSADKLNDVSSVSSVSPQKQRSNSFVLSGRSSGRDSGRNSVRESVRESEEKEKTRNTPRGPQVIR